MVVVERQSTAQHDVEDHAARPDVDLGSRVQSGVGDKVGQSCTIMGARERKRADALSRDDLGGGVVRRTARGLEEVAVAHDVGQAKVGNLDVQVLVEQEAVRESQTANGCERAFPMRGDKAERSTVTKRRRTFLASSRGGQCCASGSSRGRS